MARHDLGPRRSDSIESYLRETRAIAVVAVLALVGGVVADVFERHFWSRHPLLAGLASSLIVVMLSVALINEALERRSRRRWSVLAQYVMLQLVRNARMIWTRVPELAGWLPSEGYTAETFDAAARDVRDTQRLAEAVRELVADGDRRRLLHDGIDRSVSYSDELLGRWAGLMLNADAYAEVVDRHVELASDVAWLGSLLDYHEPTEDEHGRRWRSLSPAVQIEGQFDDERLADRIVTITQLAEELDRRTLALALRIVPVEWWAGRLGTPAPDLGLDCAAPASDRTVEAQATDTARPG